MDKSLGWEPWLHVDVATKKNIGTCRGEAAAAGARARGGGVDLARWGGRPEARAPWAAAAGPWGAGRPDNGRGGGGGSERSEVGRRG